MHSQIKTLDDVIRFIESRRITAFRMKNMDDVVNFENIKEILEEIKNERESGTKDECDKGKLSL